MNELRPWRSVRRFAVPRWMIERATQRRLAGDWRGACAAAQIDVALDLTRVRARTAERIEADLLHLAPDLLRWHVTRPLPEPLLQGRPVLLARYPDVDLQLVPRYPGTPSQRLALTLGRTERRDLWQGLHDSRELWDARFVPRLLDRLGGRPPFLTLSGARLPEPEWGLAERITALQDDGDWAAAWQLAGFDVSALVNPRTPRPALATLPTARHGLAALAATARETAAAAGERHAVVRLGWGGALFIDTETLAVRHSRGEGSGPLIPAARLDRLVDLDLVRFGHLPVDGLHPLVDAALFPERPPASGPPPAPAELTPVRVRCRGDWHLVGAAGPHPPEELRRELALRALGGAPLTGCFAAEVGWRDPAVRLPKALRLRRRQIVLHAVHGDGPALEAWLDAGLDPHLRDPAGRTLLHLLSWLPEPESLLLRLLAAGLDLEARDHTGLTPLLHAIARGGTPEAVRALLTMDASRDGWERVAKRAGRLEELGFVADMPA